MNTLRAGTILAALLLPGAGGADPAATPAPLEGPWSLAIGTTVPVLAPSSRGVELPPFLVLSAPYRNGGTRFEPELGFGSGRYQVQGMVEEIGADLDSWFHTIPVSIRWVVLGVTVAKEWQAPGASAFLGPRLAAMLRHERGDRAGLEGSADGLDWQFGLAGGAELELTPSIAAGGSLRLGWTVLPAFDTAGIEDGTYRHVDDDAETQFGADALLSVRVAL